jgi:hypothetical protein
LAQTSPWNEITLESADEPITTGIPRGSWWLYAAESELIATNLQSIMARA